MSEKITFELITVDTKFIRERVAEGHPHLDDFVIGEYEVVVTWPDSYTEFYGPYSTKKDAQDMMRGAKRSKWTTFLDKVKDD